jgi:hypothetical protein
VNRDQIGWKIPTLITTHHSNNGKPHRNTDLDRNENLTDLNKIENYMDLDKNENPIELNKIENLMGLGKNENHIGLDRIENHPDLENLRGPRQFSTVTDVISPDISERTAECSEIAHRWHSVMRLFVMRAISQDICLLIADVRMRSRKTAVPSQTFSSPRRIRGNRKAGDTNSQDRRREQ